MNQTQNNYAFIDCQNVHQGIKELGWLIKWDRFRVYLSEKYNVSRVYMFLGYVPKYQKMYDWFNRDGYVLIFKEISGVGGDIKGNVDVDLTLQVMLDITKYDKAILVTSDGDFASLIKHLDKNDKFGWVLSPCYETCAKLLRQAAGSKIQYLNSLKSKIG